MNPNLLRLGELSSGHVESYSASNVTVARPRERTRVLINIQPFNFVAQSEKEHSQNHKSTTFSLFSARGAFRFFFRISISFFSHVLT